MEHSTTSVKLHQPEYFVFDIDGTLTKITVYASPNSCPTVFENLCKNAVPNQNMINLVQTLVKGNANIIFYTARLEKYRQVTEEWINEHCGMVPTEYILLMLDNEIVKRKKYTKPKYTKPKLLKPYKQQIQIVFDDDDEVLETLQLQGYVCLQVNQKFEVV